MVETMIQTHTEMGLRVAARRKQKKTLLRLVAALIFGVIAREIFIAVYFVRELLLFAALVALAVFFAAGLVVLGMLAHSVFLRSEACIRRARLRMTFPHWSHTAHRSRSTTS